MADPRLEKMRQELKQESEKRANNGRSSGSNGGDNAVYQLFNIPEGGVATFRFLPDKDDTNVFFWVKRETIRLPFSGVVGGAFASDMPVQVTVPCMSMYGETCPISVITRPWWKDKAKESLARKYYKKSSFICQGFVVGASPFQEQSVPENPIRRVIIGPSLLNKLKAGLSDSEMEYSPTDYLNGCDFRVRKSKKSGFNNYDLSDYARRPRALDEVQRLAIDQHGLWDLKQFLGTKPDAAGVELIKVLFQASLAGEPFDVNAFGETYRPYASSYDDDAPAKPLETRSTTSYHEVALPKTDEATDDSDEKTVADITSRSENPQDLLNKLRQRTANRA